ncbi:PREDICTED: indole glucosinolate O-methyltransferase 1-like [Tarenaya hassleriana]|uniref:indole glucosinolate O-methyltransferase 1-like n=1 Tax=Tarenaya hassleriana TaxID=28532 RepID=UPI00053CA09A|nr:PREDICTED: indole glucosinolate O-methyltransferase 1-like [Tarenaya hassleriana]
MSKVGSFQEQGNPNPKPLHEQEDDEEIGTRRLALSGSLPMVLRSAVELGLIDTLHVAAEEGKGAYLSPSEIALRLPSVPTNPNAPDMLNRVLRLLASFSVVDCRTVQTAEKVESVYRAKPICRFLLKDGCQKGSLGPLLLLINDTFNLACWSHLKEVIVEGGTAFNREYGMSEFAYKEREGRMADLFERAMSNYSKLLVTKFLEVYKGFGGAKVLVDVGGANGATLSLVTSKYPRLKAINFDLPYVVANAPSLPGMEHVGGDMFVNVPKGDAIILKHVLHNWSDEKCVKILKNCWKALPDNGKVIVMESVFLDQTNGHDDASDIVALEDVLMLVFCEGGRERTKAEFEALALNSGFAACELICSAYKCWVMEFRKNI